MDKLYQEAEVATEKYNGAKEKADAAGERLKKLQDQAARKEERLNSARDALGSVAAAQYRDGGIDPALQLALSDDPDRYLENAEFVERAYNRQKSAVAGVRKQLREIEQLRGAAHIELASLKSRQTELKRHKKTITGKLGSARQLLSRLTAQERARIAEAPGANRASRSLTDLRDTLAAPGSMRLAGTQRPRGRRRLLRLPEARQPLRLGRDGSERLRLLGPRPGRVPLRGRLASPHDVLPDRRRPPCLPLRTPPR